jgi:hypothetical protein
LEPLFSGEAVAVIGSRLLPQSQTERSWRREISSRIFNLLAHLVLSVSVSDLQCGFKAVDRRRFEEIAGLMEEDAWLFDTELICLLQRRGFLIKELPVEWRENRMTSGVARYTSSVIPFPSFGHHRFAAALAE